MTQIPVIDLDDLSELPTAFTQDNGQFQLRVMSGSVQIDAIVRLSPRPKGLLCFLPSAQDRSKPPNVPYFPRWSWEQEFIEYDFIVLSDPVLRMDLEVHSSWFLHNEIDVIADISDFIDALLAARRTRPADVLFYGSSMGGFAAIALASIVRGARAVAEVPQIDMTKFPELNALHQVDEMLGGSGALDKLSKLHPERTNVLERVLAEKHLPSALIITNRADSAFNEHLEIAALSSDRLSQLRSVGAILLHVSARHAGHSVLGRSDASKLIRDFLESDNGSVRVRISPDGSNRFPLQEPDFTVSRNALPLQLTKAPKWFSNTLEVSQSFTMRGDFEHEGTGSQKAVVVAFDIEGLSVDRAIELGLMNSSYNGFGFFKYVKLNNGLNSVEFNFQLRNSERLYGIAFSEWESGPSVLTSFEIF